MAPMRAACLCGGIQIKIEGKLGPIVYCHCSRCRKASGSAFATGADVRSRYWNLTSGKELLREFESSPGVFRAFCKSCGSPVYSRRANDPNAFRLRLGLLRDDPVRRPIAHFWVSAKAGWFEIADELPQYELGSESESSQVVLEPAGKGQSVR